MSERGSLAKGMGCLFLFALPFAGVGVFMAYLILSSFWAYLEARSWEEVPATIESVELDTHRDSDSTSYEVTARYRYAWQGRELTGDRVSIHRGADSVGSFHEDTYGELLRRRKTGFRCFVNPESPTDSVLYRGLRWELIGFYSIFLITFGGVGFGLMGAGIYGARKSSREAELAALHPESPWLQKEEWKDGRVVSSTKAALITTAVFAVFWNAVSSPVLFFAHDEIFDEENRLALLALLFPLVGVVLVGWTLRNLARYRKFGESVFEMQTMPGVIGGALAGTVRTSVNIRPEDGFELTLSSIRRRRTGSGKNRSTEERVLWQASHRIARELMAFDRRRSAIPVSFAIPYDCEPTDETNPDNRVIWRLSVGAAVPGVDYEAYFEVPVFLTEASSESFRLDETSAEHRVELDLDRALEKAGVLVELLPTGKRFVFPVARHVGLALGLTFFFAVWTAVVVGLHHSDAPRLFPWVFGVFDVLIFLGVLDLWLYRSRVEVRPGSLSFASGVFWTGGPRTLTSADVDQVATKRGMQSGNKLYYQLEAQDRHGRSYTLAKRLPGLEAAKRLATEIETVLRS